MPQPSVTVSLTETGTRAIEAASTTTIEGNVQYADVAPPLAGQTSATITLTLAAPEGWIATIEPATPFTLAPDAAAPFTVTLTAPTLEAGAPDATGTAAVTAFAQSSDGRTAQGEANVAIAATAPPAIPTPWYQTPGGIGAIAGAILLLAAIVGYTLWRQRQTRLAAVRAEAERAAYLDRETGITLALAGGPLQYGHKREIVYRLALTNTSPRPRVALVEAIDIPNGWRAATQVSKIPLSVGETQHTTIVVTPDAVITPGDKANVIIRARPEEAREKDERLHLEVIAPKHGVPTDPSYRIVTVHREGANNQIMRR